MQIARYLDQATASTDLDPFEDATDWLAGLESLSYVTAILRTTRALSATEARRRARRANYFAKAAGEFIAVSRDARAHVAFLPVYYAYLNLCKMILACSDFSSAVDGGITHGVSYNVGLKNSQSLFTEQLRMFGQGVFPLLYQLLTGSPLPIRKRSRFRSIALNRVYSRLLGVTLEYSACNPVSNTTNLAAIWWHGVNGGDVDGFRLSGTVKDVYSQPLPVGCKLPPLLNWSQPDPGQLDLWASLPQKVPIATDFDLDLVLNRRLLYLNNGIRSPRATTFALPWGRMVFPEEIPIFLALYHLSSVVRYKPRFLDTLANSVAWPLVLSSRRHLLFRGIMLAISNVMQKNFWISVA